MSDNNDKTSVQTTGEIEDNMKGIEDNGMERLSTIIGMYEDWFLEYASYVILDRAVPYIEDGLKPVQRRLMHAMKEMDDGRFNKVANIIGQTMQYHPHGDAAIRDALVNLGQKELLVETQGNWGNILTGDDAAAPRYIEARLSPFALEVVFNPDITEWQVSYDGRKREPVTLPVMFPLVLAQGIEGIAVGLSTKILPHNFRELCEASIAYLKNRDFQLYPDFPTGGLLDVHSYNRGERGGKIRIRAKIEVVDKKTLVISEIPSTVTTTSLIESILKANDKGKIKIRKIEDNTAGEVDIVVHLNTGVNPDIMVDALYAFTDCEVSISPNCCIIIDNQPVFTNVEHVLKLSTDKTVDLLRRELVIKKNILEEKWHFFSLEKIFIEHRIYRDIEEEETWEGVISAIDKGLAPHVHVLYRNVTEEDIVRLTEIKIKRISKYDIIKADEAILKLEKDLEEVKYHLHHLTDYAINHFKHILQKYGKDKERKTELRLFDSVQRTIVAADNVKLYMDREGGFVGYGSGLKKEEYICDCSDIDDIIVFLESGSMLVTQAAEKSFVGKGIIHAAVWKKGDDRTTYHMIYLDSHDNRSYVKRFQVTGITRDREYSLTKSKKQGFVHYLSVQPNAESEIVTVFLKAAPRLRKTQLDVDFGEVLIKNRSAGGNLLTRWEIRKVVRKSQGVSTLGGRDIWFDDILFRLNCDEVGKYLGNFENEDRILVLYQDGTYELTTYDLTNRYDAKGRVVEVLKLTPDIIITAIYLNMDKRAHFVKRFQVETTSIDQKFCYISEISGSKLKFVTTIPNPVVRICFSGKKKDIELDLSKFVGIKGWKAVGNKIVDDRELTIEMISNKKQETIPGFDEFD